MSKSQEYKEIYNKPNYCNQVASDCIHFQWRCVKSHQLLMMFKRENPLEFYGNENGLTSSWNGDCWMNPPFKECDKWERGDYDENYECPDCHSTLYWTREVEVTYDTKVVKIGEVLTPELLKVQA